MEIAIVLRYVLVLCIVWITVETAASRTGVLKTSRRVSHRENRHEPKTRDNRHEDMTRDNNIESLPSSKTKKTKPCCLNGGLCIMNAFCHCKKNFYGRRCEHRQRHRSCGTLSHGTWMALACHLCHCFDGQISCKASTISGCENRPFTKGIESEPDYNVPIDKKVEDYDRFYDGYEEDMALSSGVSLNMNIPFALVAAILTVIRSYGS